MQKAVERVAVGSWLEAFLQAGIDRRTLRGSKALSGTGGSEEISMMQSPFGYFHLVKYLIPSQPPSVHNVKKITKLCVFLKT